MTFAYDADGQMVAVQTKLSTGASTFYYTDTDHLVNVAA